MRIVYENYSFLLLLPQSVKKNKHGFSVIYIWYEHNIFFYIKYEHIIKQQFCQFLFSNYKIIKPSKIKFCAIKNVMALFYTNTIWLKLFKLSVGVFCSTLTSKQVEKQQNYHKQVCNHTNTNFTTHRHKIFIVWTIKWQISGSYKHAEFINICTHFIVFIRLTHRLLRKWTWNLRPWCFDTWL